MRCSEGKEWMSLHLDDLLSQDRVLRLEEHISGCEVCSQEREVMRRLSAALGRAPMVAPSTGFTAGVALRLERRADSRRRLYSGIRVCLGSVGLWGLAGMASLLLFFALWQPLMRVALLDMGLALVNGIVSLLAALAKALRAAARALSAEPTWLLLFGYGLLALGLTMLWARVVLRGWRRVSVRFRS